MNSERPDLHHGETRLVQCTTGAERYCLDISYVEAIHRVEHMHPNPLPGGPIGWIRQEDEEIPVHDLTSRLGSAPRVNSRTADGTVLVLRTHRAAWGLAVDRVSRPVWVDQREITPLPALAGRSRTMFRGVVLLGGAPVLCLSPENISPGAAQTPDSSQISTAVTGQARTLPLAAHAHTHPGRILIFQVPTQMPGPSLIAGLSFPQVVEVTPALPVTRVPLAPVHVAGIVEWREHPVPLIDLGALLGVEPSGVPQPKRIVIVRGAAVGQLMALPVATDVRWIYLPIPHSDYQGSYPLNWTYCRGAFEAGVNELLVVPDLDRLHVQTL